MHLIAGYRPLVAALLKLVQVARRAVASLVCGAGYEIRVMFCRACKEASGKGDHYHRECRCGERWVERPGDPGDLRGQ